MYFEENFLFFWQKWYLVSINRKSIWNSKPKSYSGHIIEEQTITKSVINSHKSDCGYTGYRQKWLRQPILVLSKKASKRFPGYESVMKIIQNIRCGNLHKWHKLPNKPCVQLVIFGLTVRAPNSMLSF
jgi:hypothetical protein